MSFKEELGTILQFMLDTAKHAIETTPAPEPGQSGRGKTPVMADDTRPKFLQFRDTHPQEWANFIKYAGKYENRDLEPIVPSNPELAKEQELARTALEAYRKHSERVKELMNANPKDVQEVAISELCAEYRKALSNGNKLARNNPFGTVAEAIGVVFNIAPETPDNNGNDIPVPTEPEPDTPPAG